MSGRFGRGGEGPGGSSPVSPRSRTLGTLGIGHSDMTSSSPPSSLNSSCPLVLSDPFILCEYDSTQYEFVREERVNVRVDKNHIRNEYTIKLPGICCVDMLCLRVSTSCSQKRPRGGSKVDVERVEFSGKMSTLAGGEMHPVKFCSNPPRDFFKLDHDRNFARSLVGFGCILNVCIDIFISTPDIVEGPMESSKCEENWGKEWDSDSIYAESDRVKGDSEVGDAEDIEHLVDTFTTRLDSVCVYGCLIDKLPLGSKNLSLVNSLFHVEQLCADVIKQLSKKQMKSRSERDRVLSLRCDCIDVGLLCGISLSRGRKFVQAVECLRGVEGHLNALLEMEEDKLEGQHRDSTPGNPCSSVARGCAERCKCCINSGTAEKAKASSVQMGGNGMEQVKVNEPAGNSPRSGLLAMMRAKVSKSKTLAMRTRFSSCPTMEDILIQMAKCELFIADSMYQHCDFRSQISALFAATDLYYASKEQQASASTLSGTSNRTVHCKCACHEAVSSDGDENVGNVKKRGNAVSFAATEDKNGGESGYFGITDHEGSDGNIAHSTQPMRIYSFPGRPPVPTSSKRILSLFDPYADPKYNLGKISKLLIEFLVNCCINDVTGYESVRIIGMKTLAHVLETVGCHVGPQVFGNIIENIYENHPAVEILKAKELDSHSSYLLDASMNSAFSYDSREDSLLASNISDSPSGSEKALNGPNTNKSISTPADSRGCDQGSTVKRMRPPSPLVLDAYGRLFDTCSSLLVHFSPDMLLNFAQETLQHLLLSIYPSELQVQLLRMYVVCSRILKNTLPPCFELYTLVLYWMLMDDNEILKNAAAVAWDDFSKGLTRQMDIRRDFESFSNWVSGIMSSWPLLPEPAKALSFLQGPYLRRIASRINVKQSAKTSRLVVKLVKDIFNDDRMKYTVQNYTTALKGCLKAGSNATAFEGQYSQLLSTIRLAVCTQMKALAESCVPKDSVDSGELNQSGGRLCPSPPIGIGQFMGNASPPLSRHANFGGRNSRSPSIESSGNSAINPNDMPEEEDVLDSFCLVWQMLLGVSQIAPSFADAFVSDLVCPVIESARRHCEESSPTQSMLNILFSIIKEIGVFDPPLIEASVQFIKSLAKWLPCITNDQGYDILHTMIRKVADSCDSELLISLLDSFCHHSKSYLDSHEEIRLMCVEYIINSPKAISNDTGKPLMKRNNWMTSYTADTDALLKRISSIDLNLSSEELLGESDGSPKMLSAEGSLEASGSFSKNNSVDEGTGYKSKTPFAVFVQFTLFDNSFPTSLVDLNQQTLSLNDKNSEFSVFTNKLKLFKGWVSRAKFSEYIVGDLLKSLPTITYHCSKLLDHGNADVRALGFETMGSFSEAISSCLPRWISAMKNNNANARSIATPDSDALTLYYMSNRCFFLILMKALKLSSDADIQLKAVRGIVIFFDKTMPYLHDSSMYDRRVPECPERQSSQHYGPGSYSYLRLDYMVILLKELGRFLNSPWRNARLNALQVVNHLTGLYFAGVCTNMHAHGDPSLPSSGMYDNALCDVIHKSFQESISKVIKQTIESSSDIYVYCGVKLLKTFLSGLCECRRVQWEEVAFSNRQKKASGRLGGGKSSAHRVPKVSVPPACCYLQEYAAFEAIWTSLESTFFMEPSLSGLIEEVLSSVGFREIISDPYFESLPADTSTSAGFEVCRFGTLVDDGESRDVPRGLPGMGGSGTGSVSTPPGVRNSSQAITSQSLSSANLLSRMRAFLGNSSTSEGLEVLVEGPFAKGHIDTDEADGLKVSDTKEDKEEDKYSKSWSTGAAEESMPEDDASSKNKNNGDLAKKSCSDVYLYGGLWEISEQERLDLREFDERIRYYEIRTRLLSGENDSGNTEISPIKANTERYEEEDIDYEDDQDFEDLNSGDTFGSSGLSQPCFGSPNGNSASKLTVADDSIEKEFLERDSLSTTTRTRTIAFEDTEENSDSSAMSTEDQALGMYSPDKEKTESVGESEGYNEGQDAGNNDLDPKSPVKTFQRPVSARPGSASSNRRPMSARRGGSSRGRPGGMSKMKRARQPTPRSSVDMREGVGKRRHSGSDGIDYEEDDDEDGDDDVQYLYVAGEFDVVEEALARPPESGEATYY
eukprot:Nk52_evm9s553 gene=Nk52_evmTU9s553